MRMTRLRRLAAFAAITTMALFLTGASCGDGGSGKKDKKDTGRSQTGGDAEGDSTGDATARVVERCGAQIIDENPGGDTGTSSDTGATGDVGAVGDAALDAATAMDTNTSGGMDAGSEPMLPANFMFQKQYEMRFTEFAFTEDSPGSAANSILEMFLDQSKEYPIIVLLHLKKVDPSGGEAKLRGGAGLKVDKKCDPSASDCKYKWDPKTPDKYNDVELDSDTGEIKGGLDQLNFIGTTKFASGEIEKFTLPIHDIFFRDAYLGPGMDGAVIEDGLIEGFVTEEDAENSKVSITESSTLPISDLLGKENMNYDSDDDGEVDSWCLQASFSAKETTIVEN